MELHCPCILKTHWIAILSIVILSGLAQVSSSSLGCPEDNSQGCLGIASSVNGPGMPGGWMPNHSNYDQSVVNYLVGAGLEHCNADGISHNILDVYTQVVAGTNYCILFEVLPSECSDRRGAPECSQDNLQCVLKGFNPLQNTGRDPEMQQINCRITDQ